MREQTTVRLIIDRFVWLNKNSGVQKWSFTCLMWSKAQNCPWIVLEPPTLVSLMSTSILLDQPDVSGLTVLFNNNGKHLMINCLTNQEYQCQIRLLGNPKRLDSDVHRTRVVTTDLIKLFQSFLFRELLHLLGVKHLKTAHYPCANSLAERFQRALKTPPPAKPLETTSPSMLTTYLWFSSHSQGRLSCFLAELAFDIHLSLSGQYFRDTPTTFSNPKSPFVLYLCYKFSGLKYKPLRNQSTNTHVRGAFNRFPDFFCTSIQNCRRILRIQYVIAI